jgi:hypothetical protein
MCGLGKRGGMSTKSCGKPLRGHGDENGICGGCGRGRPDIHSIGTIETKPLLLGPCIMRENALLCNL